MNFLSGNLFFSAAKVSLIKGSDSLVAFLVSPPIITKGGSFFSSAFSFAYFATPKVKSSTISGLNLSEPYLALWPDVEVDRLFATNSAVFGSTLIL